MKKNEVKRTVNFQGKFGILYNIALTVITGI